MSWRHTTLRDCQITIGQGHIEIDSEGVVVSPTAYALQVLKRYGSVTGFEPVIIENTSAEEAKEAPAQAEANEPTAPKKRRRTTRKTAP